MMTAPHCERLFQWLNVVTRSGILLRSEWHLYEVVLFIDVTRRPIVQWITGGNP